MAYDEAVAGRVRKALEGSPDVVEKRMFGGIAFMAGPLVSTTRARGRGRGEAR